MKEQTALWIIIVLMTAALVAGATHATRGPYTGVSMSNGNGVFIINTATGELVQTCSRSDTAAAWEIVCSYPGYLPRSMYPGNR